MIADADILFEQFKTHNNQQVILAYNGEFNQPIINALLKNTKDKLSKLKVDRALYKKIYNVLVECIENLYKHGQSYDEAPAPCEGMAILGSYYDEYYVTVANVMTVQEAQTIESMIKEVNGMDKEGLKELYKEQILAGDISAKGGAGLGIIDIALKSGNKLDYSFHTFKEDSILFSLHVVITKV